MCAYIHECMNEFLTLSHFGRLAHWMKSVCVCVCVLVHGSFSKTTDHTNTHTHTHTHTQASKQLLQLLCCDHTKPKKIERKKTVATTVL